MHTLAYYKEIYQEQRLFVAVSSELQQHLAQLLVVLGLILSRLNVGSLFICSYLIKYMYCKSIIAVVTLKLVSLQALNTQDMQISLP